MNLLETRLVHHEIDRRLRAAETCRRRRLARRHLRSPGRAWSLWPPRRPSGVFAEDGRSG